MRYLRIQVLAIALASFVVVAPSSANSGGALGSGGEIYTVVVGSAGDLFGPEGWSDPGSPMLALRVQHPGEEPTLVPVPGTEGSERETSVFLTRDDASNTVFIAWEQSHHIHSEVKLAVFREGAWVEQIQISDLRLSRKLSPQMVITRDTFTSVGDPDQEEIHRMVLHVVWREERGASLETVYAPIILLDGVYTGSHRRVTLAETMGIESGFTPGAELFPTSLTRSQDGNSVVTSLYDPVAEEMTTARIAVLPMDLSSLADDLEKFVLETGSDFDSPDDFAFVGDLLRGHIIDMGVRMDPEIRRHVAGGLRGHIIDMGARATPPDSQGVAGEVRAEIIEIGFGLFDRGLQRPGLDRWRLDLLGDQSSPSGHVAEIRRVATWPLALGALHDGLDLFLSGDARRAMLITESAEEIQYVEADGSGWHEPQTLYLSDQLPLIDARKMLKTKLQDH